MKSLLKIIPEKKNGYLIIYALITVTVISLIAIAVITISTTETRIATTEREAQKALYTAESAIECIEYWDKIKNDFINPVNDATNSFPSYITITCDNTPRKAKSV